MAKLVTFRNICAASGALIMLSSAIVHAYPNLPPSAAAPTAPGALLSLKSMNNKFAADFFGKLTQRSAKGNIVVSPFSMAMALQMAANGAAGNTRREMLRLFTVPIPNINTLNESNEQYLGRWKKFGDGGVTLDSANGLFLKQNFPVSPQFSETLNKFYRAKVSSLDFKDQAGLSTVNDWVSESTHHKITAVLDKADSDLSMLLVNAVYFKGVWKHPFNKTATSNGVFHGMEGDTTIPMMSQRFSGIGYFDNGDVEVLALPYAVKDNGKNGSNADLHMRMLIMLPRKDKFQSFQKRLTPAWFEVLGNKVAVQEGTVRMPRFAVSYGLDCIPVLRSMGVNSAFNAASADFSKVTKGTTNKDPLYISLVQHKTVVDINEEGTEAAATTTIGASRSVFAPEPFDMNIDRPFFIAIEDDLGSIIFLARMTDIK